jgi:hypothetical protein
MKAITHIIKKAKLVGSLLLVSTATFGQKPLIVVAGIEVNGFASDISTLRTVAIKEINNSQKFIATDQYDIAEKMVVTDLNTCLGTECLTKIGATLKADYALSFTFHLVGTRIIASTKMVNVQKGAIEKSATGDFENQRLEIGRMTEIMVRKILDLPENEADIAQLVYKSPMITSKAAQRVNNNGPRIGLAIATEDNAAYLERDVADGGKDAVPVLFNIGYQLEAQYAGTKQFSFLSEFVFNAAGLEQGLFIPSMAVLTGVRFGKGSYEIAIGPSFSAKQLIKGADLGGKFTTVDEIANFTPTELLNSGYNKNTTALYSRPDSRGATYFSSNLVVGIGKTFRSGSLNVPVNAYASINKYGTSFGMSVGFNLNRKKEYIQKGIE